MLLRILILIAVLFGTAGSTAQAVSQLAVKDRDDWSGTYFRNHKLGFNHARVRKDSHQVIVNTRVYFRLKAGGADQSTIITQETRLDHNLKLKGFSLLQEIMGNRQRVEGVLKGDQLEIEITTRGYQKKKRMDFPKDVVLASTVWLNMLDRGLTVGKKGSIRIFIEPFQMISPMSYEVLRRESIKVEGTTYNAFVIRQQYAGMDSTLWVAEDGTVLLERTKNGFESRMESKTVAQDLGKEALSASSFITLSLVTVDPPLQSTEGQDEMVYRVTHLPRPDAIPDDYRQTLLKSEPQGGGTFAATLRVKREGAFKKKPARLPIRSFDPPELLEDASEIQSEHPMIKALAREIIKGETNSWKAAQAIHLWVYKNLEKVLVDSFTALDALHNRKGECQSHTNLFTAIARAGGIPTRVVNGLVYSRKYKGFLYHAWPEVFVGEWRALDPTLGQGQVDATHIKLSTGNHEGSMKLMEFIGRVGIQVVKK